MIPPARHYKPFNPEAAAPLIAGHAARPGGLLEALNALQEAFGCVDKSLIQPLADAFNLSRAEVHGVISFYHDFRDRPPGRYTIRICQAEACQSMGCRALTAHAKDRLGLDFHETDAASGISFEPVYCLGNCATAPAVMINDRVYGRVDAARFDKLVDACRKGARP